MKPSVRPPVEGRSRTFLNFLSEGTGTVLAQIPNQGVAVIQILRNYTQAVFGFDAVGVLDAGDNVCRSSENLSKSLAMLMP